MCEHDNEVRALTHQLYEARTQLSPPSPPSLPSPPMAPSARGGSFGSTFQLVLVAALGLLIGMIAQLLLVHSGAPPPAAAPLLPLGVEALSSVHVDVDADANHVDTGNI